MKNYWLNKKQVNTYTYWEDFEAVKAIRQYVRLRTGYGVSLELKIGDKNGISKECVKGSILEYTK